MRRLLEGTWLGTGPRGYDVRHDEAASKAGPPLLHGVQYLRGYAALLVAVVHANGMMRQPQYFGASPTALSLIGLFGVAVFFVISGFIITVVSFDGDRRPIVTTGDFFLRRFLRIVPFMWVVTVGYNVLSAVGTHKVEWAPFVRALALWPVGELKPNVLWSLRYEWIFYLLFAATMLTRRRFVWPLVLWFLVPLVASPFFEPINPDNTPFPSLGRELAWLLLEGSHTGANLQFGAGMLIGWLWLRHRDAFRPRLPAGPLLSLGVIVAAAMLVEKVLAPADLLNPVTWTLPAAVVFLVGLAVRPGRGLLHRGAMVLGNASYAIYLVHNAVLLIALEAAGRSRLPINPIVFWWSAVALALAGGIVVHFLVERPLVGWLTRVVRPTKASAPMPVVLMDPTASRRATDASSAVAPPSATAG